MKILFIAPRYYPHIGGVEYVVKSIAERLARMGIEVKVLAGDPKIEVPSKEIINGVEVYRWPTYALNDAYFIPKRFYELRKLVGKLASDIDIVHVHSLHTVFTVYTGFLTKRVGHRVKLVVTGHYHGEGHTTLRSILWKIWRPYTRKLLREADIVHCVSIIEAKKIVQHYPEVRNKIIVIPNGVDEDVFKYRWHGQNSDYIMYAGRIEKYKRLELAIHIAKHLNLKLLIVGEGPYKSKLKKYAEKHYPNNVVFLPSQPRHKYLELLTNAKYAINLSKHEAYSVFIAEAMTIGVPIIVSSTIAQTQKLTCKKLYEVEVCTPTKIVIKPWNKVVKSLLDKAYTSNKLAA